MACRSPGGFSPSEYRSGRRGRPTASDVVPLAEYVDLRCAQVRDHRRPSHDASVAAGPDNRCFRPEAVALQYGFQRRLVALDDGVGRSVAVLDRVDYIAAPPGPR